MDYKAFLYISTPTAICALAAEGTTLSNGKKPCVAGHAIISKTPRSWKCLKASTKLQLYFLL